MASWALSTNRRFGIRSTTVIVDCGSNVEWMRNEGNTYIIEPLPDSPGRDKSLQGFEIAAMESSLSLAEQ